MGREKEWCKGWPLGRVQWKNKTEKYRKTAELYWANKGNTAHCDFIKDLETFISLIPFLYFPLLLF